MISYVRTILNKAMQRGPLVSFFGFDLLFFPRSTTPLATSSHVWGMNCTAALHPEGPEQGSYAKYTVQHGQADKQLAAVNAGHHHIAYVEMHITDCRSTAILALMGKAQQRSKQHIKSR